MIRLADRVIRKVAVPAWVERYDDTNEEYSDGLTAREIFNRAVDRTQLSLSNGCPIFVVDNVAEYYFAISQKTDWSLQHDFPALAPPFERFWIEAHGPSGVRMGADEFKKWNADAPRFFGMHVLAANRDELLKTSSGIYLAKKYPMADWLFSCDIYLLFNPREGFEEPTLMGSLYLPISRDGTIDGREDWLQFEKPRYVSLPTFATPRWTLGQLAVFMKPLLLGLTFLNCKNVSQEEVEPPPKLSKARMRRDKTAKPMVRYKVLNIQPMQKAIRHASDTHGVGEAKALHICRGHFKTFTQMKPLFGRVTGTFWWDWQVRGNEANGRVIKDYEIEAPREDPRHEGDPSIT